MWIEPQKLVHRIVVDWRRVVLLSLLSEVIRGRDGLDNYLKRQLASF